MYIQVNLKEHSYPVRIEKHALCHLSDLIDVNRRMAIISDSQVPQQWIDIVRKQCPHSIVLRFPTGEASKSFRQYENLLKELIQAHFTRKDAIIALGGGVTGDLAGFVAATYMRGIDFYNIPTTLLAQVDSSVGGKVAIDVDAYKNIVGAFWQPKAVIIDPDVLTTLPDRQIHNGLAEALKTGLIMDPVLINLFEQEPLPIEQIILRSIQVKADVVSQDEKEAGLRKILNFGHTIGHALESDYGLNTYLHGECVAMGMLFFIEDPLLKQRVLSIYQRLDLPNVPDYDVERIMERMLHDKKNSGKTISVVKVPKAGTFRIDEMDMDSLRQVLERGPYEK